MATIEPEMHVMAQKLNDHEARLNNHSDRIAKMELGCARHEPLLEGIAKALDKMAKDIDDLKDKPGKRWELLVGQVINLIMGGVIGYMITQILRR
jgi:hypothetical protein